MNRIDNKTRTAAALPLLFISHLDEKQYTIVNRVTHAKIILSALIVRRLVYPASVHKDNVKLLAHVSLNSGGIMCVVVVII